MYRARDTRLGRDVAIKILPERLTGNAQALARFEREARAVAALSHPNILALHDVGRENAIVFAVMELLEGETLDRRIAREDLSWNKALEIGAAVADGLSSAGPNAKRCAMTPDGYSSRSASLGATVDARSAGSNDAASTVATDMAAAISSVRGSLGAMP